MKRPTWATIVGILGIIFSCFGILGAGQEIMMPKIMEVQNEMFTQIDEVIRKEAEEKKLNRNETKKELQFHEDEGENVPDFPIEIFKSMGKMLEFPEWYSTWSVIFGVFKLIVSGFLLYVSICLLQVKPSSINLFYWAAGLSIFLSVTKGIVSLFAISFMGMAMMFGGMFGVVIDIVLLIVVATGNKDAFYRKSPPPLSQST